MAKVRRKRIVETAREARGAEPGPSMFVVLTVSTLGVIALFAVAYMVI